MTDRTRMIFRNVVLPLNAVALIALLVWAIEAGRVPLISGGSSGGVSTSSVAPTNSEFFGLDRAQLGAAKGSGPRIGAPAPEFTLQDIDGKVVRLSDFRGKPVLINFWATWCRPCRKEFPELAQRYDAAQGSFVILGVDLGENIDDVRAFVKEYKASYPILVDADGGVARAYRLTGVPSSYFVDANGILRDEYFGPLSGETLDSKTAALRAFGGG